MPRPGTKITSFPPQPQTTPLSGALSTPLPPITGPIIPPQSSLPMPLPLQPQNVGLPPQLVAEEPISFPDDMTIDELIETRRNVGKNSPIYWAAFDEIQRKRDMIYNAHFNSWCKAMQDNTIALYTVNKKKVPDTVGKPFLSD